MAYSEVARWTGTEIAALGIGTAVTAGGLRRATFVDVLAPTTELFVLEASRTHALVAPQRVVAGGSSANVSAEAFIFIWRKKPEDTAYVIPARDCCGGVWIRPLAAGQLALP